MCIKKTNFIRSVAFFLALVMVLSFGTVANASLAADNEAATAPELNIVTTFVEGGKYVEIGLNIKSGTNSFQSAGAVLKYDPQHLTPVNWVVEEGQTDPAEIALHSENLDTSTGSQTVPNWQNIWHKATPVPTKGADNLSGKLAKAFELTARETTDAGTKTGYLYLSG